MTHEVYVEDKVREFVLDRFVPALHHCLREANRPLFERHYGSCCNQTSIMVARFLSDMHFLELDWQVFEGIFRGNVLGREVQYNHAWVWGSGAEGRFLDLAHVRPKRVWMTSAENRHPESHRWTEVGRRLVPWQSMFNAMEYFTSRPGGLLYESTLRLALSDEPLSEAYFNSIRPEWAD